MSGLDRAQERLAGLDERPLAEHAEELERLHSALSAELDGLTIPKAGSAQASS